MLDTLALKQLRVVLENDWYPLFIEAGIAHNISPTKLMGIASRETEMKHIIGDFGRGFGLTQLDIGSFPDVGSWWLDIRKCLHETGKLLNEKKATIERNEGKLYKHRFNSGDVVEFIMPRLDESTKERCVIASYNCGMATAYHVSKGRDPDYGTAVRKLPNGTTIRDYSRDVLQRAEMFRYWLERLQQLKQYI